MNYEARSGNERQSSYQIIPGAGSVASSEQRSPGFSPNDHRWYMRVNILGTIVYSFLDTGATHSYCGANLRRMLMTQRN